MTRLAFNPLAVKAALAGGTALAAVLSTPAAAQAVCTTTLGLLSCTTPSGPVPVVVQAPQLPITLPGGTTTTATTIAVQSPEPILLDLAAAATSTTTDLPALTLDSAADINAQIDALTTNATGATGVLLTAVDDVVLVADDTITTLGAASDGINITAGTVSVTADQIQTVGVDSNGVELVALEGPATLNASLIDTLGDGSTDAILRAAGDIGVNVGVLRSGGDQALGLDLQSDATACAVLGAGSCDVNAVVNSITTDGFGSIGALVVAAGDTDLTVDVLQTGGDEAAGLDLSADPDACIALGVGACDTAFTVNNLTTDGARSPGAIVRAVGDIDGNVGVLRTNGADAIGLDLASDPNACVILGAGACGTSFSVGQLTTNGDGAIGALVRAAGPTTANIGVLETFGDNATGLDLAANPEACITLGLGACTTQLTGNRITTVGDNSAGVLIVSPADVVANLNTIRTAGINAPALSITGDPTACVVLGAGACDATVVGDRIITTGAGSAGVLINTPAQIVADLNTVSTDGNNAPGITLITNPAACILLGTGACGVVLGSGGGGTPGGGTPGSGTPGGPGGGTPGTPGGTDVDTDGNDSPGIVVTTPGPVDVDAGNVDTDGGNSPGIVVDGGEGPIDVDFDTIDTDGPNSPGVDVSGTGPINVGGGNVDTSGPNSPGVIVAGTDDPVTITTGTIVTRGPDSDGINVTTTTGNQTILAGPITVTGLRSDGIDADASGCATVDITARGPITATQGTGIDASSACAVRVTTLPGAPVSGSVAGINAVSGTGATIIIGDTLSSSSGPALNVDGASATVTIQPTGTLNGRFDLTNANDTLTNAGRINATQSSSFGGGTDLLTNTGTIRADGAITFAGLETLTNSGLIDMRDGAANDSLTIPGAYNGTGSARLGVDVGAGTAADRLVVGGAATGSTQVLIAGLDGRFVNGAVVVDAGAGTSATAFSANPGSIGLTDYSLAFNAGTNDFAVFGTPSATAVGASLLAQGAREIFYRGNDAVGAHLASAGAGSGGTGTEARDVQPPLSRAFWVQGFGLVQERDATLDATPFGQARSYSLDSQQDWFGLQLGADLVGGAGGVFGLTAGYIGSALKLKDTPLRNKYEAANVGVYGRFAFGPAFINGLVKYEKYWLDVKDSTIGLNSDTKGHSYGGWVEAGVRFGSDSFFVEPSASIEYAKIKLKGFTALSTGFAFDEDDGLRGKAGARVGTVFDNGPSVVTGYAKGQVIHEFNGEDRLVLSNSGNLLAFDNPRPETYGRATVGIEVVMDVPVRGFIEGSLDFANGVSGGGARGGISVAF